MKNVILSILAILSLSIMISGCGRATTSVGACSAYVMDLSPNTALVGTYHDSGNNKKLILNSDCSFVFTTITATSQYATGTWSQPVSGNIPFVVTSSNGGSCGPSGTGSMGVGYGGSPFTMQHATFTSSCTMTYVKQ